VDFGISVADHALEIYRSSEGVLDQNLQIQTMATDLTLITADLQSSIAVSEKLGLVRNAQELMKTARDCHKSSRQLLEALSRLKVDGERTKWKAIGRSLYTAWAKKEIGEAALQMARYRQVIDTRLLIDIRSVNSNLIYNCFSLLTLYICRSRFDILAIQTSEMFTDLSANVKFVINAVAENRSCFASYDARMAEFHSQTLHTITIDGDKTRNLISERLSDLKLDSPRMLPDCGLQDLARRIRQSLWFSDLDRRQDDIDLHGHYAGTFDWVFAHHAPRQAQWDNFLSWLEGNGQVYWINGKAGSGKSTLMTYICEDERTKTALHQWSGSKQVIIAKFFFWNTGSEMQRSQQGLFRSLLYQLFEQNEQLISSAFPEGHYVWSVLDNDKAPTDTIWSMKKLKMALTKVLTHHTLPVRICLFIDGLDELEGDYDELINFVGEVADAQRTKLCVSSRPLRSFGDAFRESPGLRLQDLTRSDIAYFTRGRLLNQGNIREIARREPQKVSLLVNYIVNNAEGVFIWVTFILQSLCNGLRNEDSMSDLLKRLEFLPKEIDKLYDHILSKQDPVYYEHACQIFRIMTAAREEVSLVTMSFAEKEQPKFLFSWPIANQDDKSSEMLWPTQKKLAIQCMGLIEVSDKMIRFSHQTVRDYLMQPHVQSKLLQATSSTSFNPYTSILSAYVAQMNIYTSTDGGLQEWIARIWRFTCWVEKRTGEAQVVVLDEFYHRLYALQQMQMSEMQFLHHAVRHHLVHYVRAKVSRNPDLLSDATGGLLLHTALNATVPELCLDMVSMLLAEATAHGLSHRDDEVARRLFDLKSQEIAEITRDPAKYVLAVESVRRAMRNGDEQPMHRNLPFERGVEYNLI